MKLSWMVEWINLLGEIHPNAIALKTVEDKGGQELPDDATAEQIARQPAASLRTTEPKLKNRKFAILVSIKIGDRFAAYRWICLIRTV
jgi:hypothetical protein